MTLGNMDASGSSYRSGGRLRGGVKYLSNWLVLAIWSAVFLNTKLIGRPI